MEQKMCDAVPQSEQCTDLLYRCTCPGWGSGQCSSDKFDQSLHNKQLPLFFKVQHPDVAPPPLSFLPQEEYKWMKRVEKTFAILDTTKV